MLPAQMSKIIARRQKDIIDFVVIGDGEESLVGILDGRAFNNIPNLVFAVNSKGYTKPR